VGERAFRLWAKEHFGGTQLIGITATIEQVAQHGLHQQVDEERRYVHTARAVAREQAEVIRLQRARGQQAVAKAQEVRIVVPRILIL